MFLFYYFSLLIIYIAHQLSHKQQSPGSQNGRASNLRVVIPAPTIAQNMSTADDLAYTDVSMPKSVLC